jgi:hypothetical protein
MLSYFNTITIGRAIFWIARPPRIRVFPSRCTFSETSLMRWWWHPVIGFEIVTITRLPIPVSITLSFSFAKYGRVFSFSSIVFIYWSTIIFFILEIMRITAI